MSLPDIVSRDEWLVARIALLDREKELTRARDALNADRRRLPMVEIVEDYRFTGPQGEVGLADLFEGRQQLIVYHFMFGTDWEEGCPSCTAGIDELSPGFLEHLHTRDTTFAMVSRAPLEKLEAWKAKKGWEHLTWYSSGDSDFNHDFAVTVEPAQGAREYNYRDVADDPDWPDPPYEMPGRSAFVRVGDRVFHTYSQYARGLESTGGSYYFLDLTALGRQEDWEEPKGRAESARAPQPDFAT
jgi:predicted dithiol-disulfide oxidoreductase (DUF899 family)